MRLISLVQEVSLGVASSPLAAAIASASSPAPVAAPASSPAGLARAGVLRLLEDLAKAFLLLRSSRPRELVPEVVPIEDLAGPEVELVGGRGVALVVLLPPAGAQRRPVDLHAVGQQEGPARTVKLNAQMLGDLDEVPDATRDDELLVAVEVLVRRDPRAWGRGLGIGVRERAGAGDPLLLAAPPPGDEENSERSGRVMLWRPCWLDVGPKYDDNSERLSASLSWVASAAISSLRHSELKSSTYVSKLRSNAGLYRMARRRILMAISAALKPRTLRSSHTRIESMFGQLCARSRWRLYHSPKVTKVNPSSLVWARPEAQARMWRNSQSFVMSAGWQK